MILLSLWIWDLGFGIFQSSIGHPLGDPKSEMGFVA
jgi:hypothetical protein